MIENALAFAKAGYAVFPVNGKKPTTPNGFKDAVSAPDEVHRLFKTYPGNGVGIATGKKSGVTVVDFDPPDGVELFNRIGAPKGAFVISTPRGGMHVFCRYEEGDRNKAGLVPNVDLRGEGGYVVGAGSPGYAFEQGFRLGPSGWWKTLKNHTGGVFAGIAESGGTIDSITTLGDGTRNAGLARIAGLLVAQGLDVEEVVSRALEANENLCVPPLGVDEVEGLARKMFGRYAESPGPLPGSPDPLEGDKAPALGKPKRYDELGLVRRVIATMEPEGPLVGELDTLWHYFEGVFEEVTFADCLQIIHLWADEVYFIGDKPRTFRPRRRDMREVYEHLKSFTCQLGYFDDPKGAAFNNGTLLEAGDFVDHSEAHRLRYKYPFDFDPAAKCPLWDRYLETVFEGAPDAQQRRDVLQEFAGATLFGIATRFQKALMLTGGGKNGKSQGVDVFTKLVPEGAHSAIDPHEMDQEYRRARLAGSMLNTSVEVEGKPLRTSNILKGAIHGDVISGRHIRGSLFQFRAKAAHLFACNELPDATDFTTGFKRSWIIIPFEREFTPGDEGTIPELAQKVIKDELPGVVHWAYRGALRLLEQGKYTHLPSSAKALRAWHQQSDQVLQFVEDVTTTGEAWTTLKELYFVYREWAEDDGHGILSKNKFSRRIFSLGYKKKHTNNGKVFFITLKSDGSPF